MAGLKSKSFESETLLNFTAVDACSYHVPFVIPVLDTAEGHKLLFPLIEALLNFLFLVPLLEIITALHLGCLMAPSWCTGDISYGLVGDTSNLSFVASVYLCPSFLEQDDP